jgi:hypothetical protein
MSGYIDDMCVNRDMDPHRTTFLQKPFTPDILLRTVRALLDSSAMGAGLSQESSSSSGAIPKHALRSGRGIVPTDGF